MSAPQLERQLTKKQQQGVESREFILDATERLMATKGYAATSISDIRKACGLPPSSIYWHFGSKEGVLAAVMERGADRFFAGIPTWDEADVPAEHKFQRQLTVTAALLSRHPDFLRLFYMLSLERTDDPAVSEVVRRVRDTAIERLRDAISHLLPPDVSPPKAERIVSELTAFAVALSDGVFFADHLEPETTDVERIYRRLWQAVAALIPVLVDEP
jgi:AcrR family transcriptional regulator